MNSDLSFRSRVWFEAWGVPYQLSPISFCRVEACWLEDLAAASWRDFWQTRKPMWHLGWNALWLEAAREPSFLVFMKVPPQERGFNCFWKFIIVWLLCCEIVVSLIMAKWNLELQLFAVLCAEEEHKGKFTCWYLPAHFICHINMQHPAGGKLITGFGTHKKKD